MPSSLSWRQSKPTPHYPFYLWSAWVKADDYKFRLELLGEDDEWEFSAHALGFFCIDISGPAERAMEVAEGMIKARLAALVEAFNAK